LKRAASTSNGCANRSDGAPSAARHAHLGLQVGAGNGDLLIKYVAAQPAGQ
jgi:hypothetical protein